MPLSVNLRLLETDNLFLEGNLTPEELDIDTQDEIIHLSRPLRYQVEAQMLEDGLLVSGSLSVPLDCECARCLKPFVYTVELDGWACHLPLEGEDAAKVANDCVDLTPYIREDILLEFPQHPLCDPQCSGLTKTSPGKPGKTFDSGIGVATPSPWTELNKLKL
jgi:uncharacterized metal-binding protein YceD (DUF177 family)